MTEHKFTDDEIVKGVNAYVTRMCNKCNVKDLGTCCDSCFITVISQSADLINRQKAEIEDLEIKNEHLVCFLVEARRDAIKEFAESIKLEFYREFDEIIPSIMADRIDNLVKEMTEGES